MSALYGTIIGDRGLNKTKCSTRNIKTACQSWDGSIIVEMNKEGNFEISIGRGSTTNRGITLQQGNIKDLLRSYEN